MKPILSRLTRTAHLILGAPLHAWRFCGKHKVPALLVTAIVLTSCFQHYFLSGTSRNIDAATIDKWQRASKYFVLHGDNNIWGMENVTVTGNTIQGDLVNLPPEHRKYLNPDTEKTNRVKKEDKTITLMEVHLYTKTPVPSGQTHVMLQASDLNRMDVYEFDKSHTNANHALSWAGVIVGGVIAVFGIAFLIACNCPQVYVNNNGQYEFKSGVYSGAVYSSLERPDYLPLDGIQLVDNTYRLRIANAKEEEQFINQSSLLWVKHPADVRLLADRNGKIHSYKNPVAARRAVYDEETNVTQALKFTDEQYYSFTGQANPGGFSEVTLQFDRPAGSQKGKLLVHGGNSNWSGYLYREFAALFGEGYEKWRRQQEEAGSANAQQWLVDQGLPMKVYLETEKGWKYIDHFALTGNTASRDMIMEIDLEGLRGHEVKIRIESAYKFWDLDRAAMDFSPDVETHAVQLQPAEARTRNGQDVKAGLLQKDKNYVQLSGDDYLDLVYGMPEPGRAEESSLFLVTEGYYHNLKKYEGKPDVQALVKFKEKGAFDRYSRSKFDFLLQELAKARVK